MKLERASDRFREDLVAELLGDVWGRHLRRFDDGEYGAIDWWAYDCRVPTAVVEMKCRANPAALYPTVYLAVSKRDALLAAAREFEVGPIFVPAFSCGVVAGVDVRKLADLAPVWIERKKPRASGLVGPNDAELALEVPTARFKLITRMPTHVLRQYNEAIDADYAAALLRAGSARRSG